MVGFGLLSSLGALRGMGLGQILLLTLYVRQSKGDSGCVDRWPHLPQKWAADNFLLAVSVEEAAVFLVWHVLL